MRPAASQKPSVVLTVILMIGIIVCALCTWLLLAPIGLDIGERRYVKIPDLKMLTLASLVGTAAIFVASIGLFRDTHGLLRLTYVVVVAASIFGIGCLILGIGILESDVWAFSELEAMLQLAAYGVIVAMISGATALFIEKWFKALRWSDA